MELLRLLNWRYATKLMNGQQVPQDKLDRILEAARLAPTSNGLQPFEVFVISSQELKEKISPIAANQPQILGCSHLLVFATWHQYTEPRINRYIAQIATGRGIPSAALEDFRLSLLRSFVSMNEPASYAHASRQAYLALGVTLIAAAAEGVDSSPMEGFEPAKLDEVLGLKEKGLRSVVLLALGYREAAKDWLVSLPKVRRHRSELIREIH